MSTRNWSHLFYKIVYGNSSNQLLPSTCLMWSKTEQIFCEDWVERRQMPYFISKMRDFQWFLREKWWLGPRNSFRCDSCIYTESVQFLRWIEKNIKGSYCTKIDIFTKIVICIYQYLFQVLRNPLKTNWFEFTFSTSFHEWQMFEKFALFSNKFITEALLFGDLILIFLDTLRNYLTNLDVLFCLFCMQMEYVLF